MFYTTDGPHGLPYNPFKAIVAPRPIGWISSRGADGTVNLAPYSYFNAVHDTPPMVVFSSQGWKDTIQNVTETGQFVCNYCSASMKDAMNASSGPVPRGTSEFDVAGLERVASQTVDVPRVGGTPAALECVAVGIVPLKTADGAEVGSHVVIGHVTGVFIDDAFIKDGRFDAEAADPIMRMGYRDYSGLGPMFELARPG